MGNIRLQLGFKASVVEVPFVFIDHYMIGCLPVYPLIYIFSLRKLMAGESVSSGEISEKFNLTEGDVLNAWRHWEKVGLVELNKSAADGDFSIIFLPVHAPDPSQTTQENAGDLQHDHTEGMAARLVMKESRPQYTVQELTMYRSHNKEIAHLFACAEQTLGKLLSYNDLAVIFGMHDWLRLPLDVIEYLLNYCADNDHRNLRYIEKCALDWADNSIDDLEKALIYVQNFDSAYREILRYMGQSGYPTPSHRKYMDRWLNEWNMPLALIMEACDRSVAAIDKPKFSYVDKILVTWNKAGITTLEAAKAADAAFHKTKDNSNNVYSINKTSVKQKQNRFVNFNQRENDYSHFEKLEKAYLAQKLSEG